MYRVPDHLYFLVFPDIIKNGKYISIRFPWIPRNIHVDNECCSIIGNRYRNKIAITFIIEYFNQKLEPNPQNISYGARFWRYFKDGTDI